MDHDFKNLLKLLDDDNEQLAGIAMAELICRADSGLDRVLRTLQETPNTKLRKRIHQLQSAIVHRRRRKIIADKLDSGNLTLTEGMIQLHLFWYDNDTVREMTDQWNEFMESLGKNGPPSSIERVLIRFSATVFSVYPPDARLNPEAVCIGTILEKGFALDFMACIAARLCVEHWNYSAEIISIEQHFYLKSGDKLFNPEDHWHKISFREDPQILHWSDQELLRLIACTLFMNAVATDSFRYIHTLGCCTMQRSDLKALPYPYGGSKDTPLKSVL